MKKEREREKEERPMASSYNNSKQQPLVDVDGTFALSSPRLKNYTG